MRSLRYTCCAEHGKASCGTWSLPLGDASGPLCLLAPNIYEPRELTLKYKKVIILFMSSSTAISCKCFL